MQKRIRLPMIFLNAVCLLCLCAYGGNNAKGDGLGPSEILEYLQENQPTTPESNQETEEPEDMYQKEQQNILPLLHLGTLCKLVKGYITATKNLDRFHRYIPDPGM